MFQSFRDKFHIKNKSSPKKRVADVAPKSKGGRYVTSRVKLTLNLNALGIYTDVVSFRQWQGRALTFSFCKLSGFTDAAAGGFGSSESYTASLLMLLWREQRVIPLRISHMQPANNNLIESYQKLLDSGVAYTGKRCVEL